MPLKFCGLFKLNVILKFEIVKFFLLKKNYCPEVEG